MHHAPGWLPDYIRRGRQSLHRAPVGAYLLIRFQNVVDGSVTPALPQAVMDHRNNAISFDKITARDISDTQRRGMCMAAAMTFGLAYELWAKLPLESGYASPGEEAPAAPKAAPAATKAPSAAAAKVSESSFRALRRPANADFVVNDKPRRLRRCPGKQVGGRTQRQVRPQRGVRRRAVVTRIIYLVSPEPIYSWARG